MDGSGIGGSGGLGVGGGGGLVYGHGEQKQRQPHGTIDFSRLTFIGTYVLALSIASYTITLVTYTVVAPPTSSISFQLSRLFVCSRD